MRLELAEALQIDRERCNDPKSRENCVQKTFRGHLDSERVKLTVICTAEIATLPRTSFPDNNFASCLLLAMMTKSKFLETAYRNYCTHTSAPRHVRVPRSRNFSDCSICSHQTAHAPNLSVSNMARPEPLPTNHSETLSDILCTDVQSFTELGCLKDTYKRFQQLGCVPMQNVQKCTCEEYLMGHIHLA